MDHRKIALWGAATIAAAAVVWALAAPASAADLGGTCCADLEERVQELEATVARKGNRKVTLEVSGVLNAALISIDTGDFDSKKVALNGNDESRLKFAGKALITPDLSAGYVLTLEVRDLALLNAPIGSKEPKVQQSYWWLESKQLGRMSVGRAAMATKGFNEISTSNAWYAQKPLSAGALSDAFLTGIDVPFDGTYRDIVRYDTPNWGGFVASASWGSSLDALASDGNGDNYDVALRYSGEQAGFKIAGGLGYRVTTDLEINLLNIASVTVPTGDVDTILAAGSVKHMGSGLFLTANYADQDWDTADFNLKGYALTGGIETKLNSLGLTTFFGEWNQFKLDTGGGDGDITVYGAGIVQEIDAAAMALYLTYRKYDLGDFSSDDIDAITAGARIKF